ncbi:MAG TPA: nicotinate-nucleotide adenylyltransferase [Caulobacteraceae bacterium]|nr:nicotinate-nucleotide adenylyltransferase [Caulobacteraceae bacterium]
MSEPRLPVEPGWKVGLFGGSFDPAHAGHRHVADLALDHLKLDRVVWLVSPGNPLKDEAHLTLPARMAAARALADPKTMPVSDIERRFGTRPTIDLLTRLKAVHPDVHFVWLMGSDNVESFPRWRAWREIAALVPIGVIARPGSEDADRTSEFARAYAAHRVPLEQAAALPLTPPPAWVWIPGPLHPASSTAIRAGGRNRQPSSLP